MVAKRRIRAARLDLCAQSLHQIGQLVGIFGLVCVENLRLQIAALLRSGERRAAQ